MSQFAHHKRGVKHRSFIHWGCFVEGGEGGEGGPGGGGMGARSEKFDH